jgi:hypothetical protein
VERDVGTLVGERQPDRAPEALPCARHQDDLVGQPEVHASAILSAATSYDVFFRSREELDDRAR